MASQRGEDACGLCGTASTRDMAHGGQLADCAKCGAHPVHGFVGEWGFTWVTPKRMARARADFNAMVESADMDEGMRFVAD